MKRKYVKPMIVLCLLATLAIVGTLAYLTDTTGQLANEFTVDKKVDIELNETANDFEIIPGESYVKDPTITVVEDDCYVFAEVVETIPTAALTDDPDWDGTEADKDSTYNYYTFADYVTYKVDTESKQGTTSGDPAQDWYWSLVAVNTGETTTATSVTATGTYTDGGDNFSNPTEYTTVTYVYAVTDASGNLLVLSSDDCDDFEVLSGNTASVPETVTQEMMDLIPDTDATDDGDARYSIDLTFTGYAIQTSSLEVSDTLTIADIYDFAYAGTTEQGKGVTTTTP